MNLNRQTRIGSSLSALHARNRAFSLLHPKRSLDIVAQSKRDYDHLINVIKRLQAPPSSAQA
jgi:hypothetical protein